MNHWRFMLKIKDYYEGKNKIKNIVNTIRNNHQITDKKDANKLSDCCSRLNVTYYENGRENISPNFPCHSPLCPLCQEIKINKEQAKFAGVFKKIQENKKYKNPRFYFLTLTMDSCNVNDVIKASDNLKDGFNKLKNTKEWKKVVIGYSRYFHYNLLENNNIEPHLHIMLLVKSSFTSKNKIKNDDWIKLWQTSFSYDFNQNRIDCKEIGRKGKAELKDIFNIVRYGVNSIKFEQIKKYPETYLKLMSLVKGYRKISHSGYTIQLRKEVEDEYKNRVKKDNDITDNRINNEVIVVKLKYDNNEYYQDECLVR